MNGPGSSGRVLVGIVDSGFDPLVQPALRIAAARRFMRDVNGAIQSAPVAGDAIGHGTGIAQIILEANPGIDLLVAQVFAETRECSVAQVAAALDWLISMDAAVVNLSFGIAKPDATLRLACERAGAAGAILVCSAPARGAPVFPAAYPFCIAVSGDARCAKDQISWLGSEAVDFGAHPFAMAGNPQSGGASFAAARITARVARLLNGGIAASEIRTSLRAQSSYHGPELKHASLVQTAVSAKPEKLHP